MPRGARGGCWFIPLSATGTGFRQVCSTCEPGCGRGWAPRSVAEGKESACHRRAPASCWNPPLPGRRRPGSTRLGRAPSMLVQACPPGPGGPLNTPARQGLIPVGRDQACSEEHRMGRGRQLRLGLRRVRYSEKVNTESKSDGRGEGVGATGKKPRPPSLPVAPLESPCHTEPFRAVERTGALEAGSA